MTAIMQAWFRSANNATVPAPVDKTTPDAPWWYDHIAAQAQFMSQSGIKAILLPPVAKTTAGSYTGADGYGCYDDYDIGSKNQWYGVPTRFGYTSELQRSVAIFKANGISAYADIVLHQRMGGNYGIYRYLGADGKTKNGRYPKNPGCFLGDTSKGYRNRDPIAGPVGDDFSFGDEVVYQNSNPPGYTIKNAIANGDWLTKYIGFEGYRIDDVKGLNAQFVHQFLTSDAMANKFAVGEYYDGNSDTLTYWVWNSGMQGRAKVFDFHFHFAIQNMCNNTSNWNMQQLYNVVQTSSQDHKVKFVENPDTDTDGFATVIWNKAQGYAIAATTEGDFMIYYKDWSKDAGCYGWGLQEHINNYVWVHNNLAFGSTIIRFADYQAFIYERQGYPGLLVGVNNDQYHGWRTVWVQTNFGANVELNDYFGHAGNIWTNQDGWVQLSIPPNENGLGTVAYSRVGYNAANVTQSFTITQEFAGAIDLDIMPFTNDFTDIGEIWVAQNSEVNVEIYCDKTGWTADTVVDIDTIEASNSVETINLASNSPAKFTHKMQKEGWLIISAHGMNLPKDTDFWCVVTYQSTKTLAHANFAKSALQFSDIDIEELSLNAGTMAQGRIALRAARLNS